MLLREYYHQSQARCLPKLWKGRLYAYPISYFAGTPRNTKHSLYTFHISFKFCVLLMLQKTYKTLWHLAQMPTLAKNCAKCGKRCAKWEKSDAKYPAIHFQFSAFGECFCIFCDKCIAGLKSTTPCQTSNLFTFGSRSNFLKLPSWSSRIIQQQTIKWSFYSPLDVDKFVLLSTAAVNFCCGHSFDARCILLNYAFMLLVFQTETSANSK